MVERAEGVDAGGVGEPQLVDLAGRRRRQVVRQEVRLGRAGPEHHDRARGRRDRLGMQRDGDVPRVGGDRDGRLPGEQLDLGLRQRRVRGRDLSVEALVLGREAHRDDREDGRRREAAPPRDPTHRLARAERCARAARGASGTSVRCAPAGSRRAARTLPRRSAGG